MRKGSIAIAALAVTLSLSGTASSWDRQASLERTAAELTGVMPAIVCETAYEHSQGVRAGGTSYYGFTLATQPKLVVLAPAICRAVRRASRTSTDFAHAVYVFAHELGHVVRDTGDETAAECYAIARWQDLAALMGLPTPTPAQLARVADAHARLPARYRGACPALAAGTD